MINIISVANKIVSCYDLTTVLTTMVACTSTFAAIIGGLIANKAISDKSEKDIIDRQIQQIDIELRIYGNELYELYKCIDNYNAKDFIRNHLKELIFKTPLANVYDPDDSNEIKYDNLLPYWNKALIALNKFRSAAGLERNNDDVPKILVDELDDFQYSICSEFHHCFESGQVSLYDTTISLDTEKYRIQYYNETFDKIVELERKTEILKAKKELLQNRCETISVGKEIKSGMKIFSTVSIINIIFPLLLMLKNPTSNLIWYYIETAISFISFIIGICIMIRYILSLFPKNNEKKERNIRRKND